MKKIQVQEEGKTFEAYVKILMIQRPKIKGEQNRLLGFAVAGSMTACRAIHASVYANTKIVVIDDETGTEEEFTSTNGYRRVEEMTGRVCHMFLLPRPAITEEYQHDLMDAQKNGRPIPDRIIMDPEGNIEEKAGQFLAATFGLPRTKDWANQYLNLLPRNKWTEIEVITTELAGPWKNLRAVQIHSMEEHEILDIVNGAIQDRQLNVQSSLGHAAVFREGMTTEQYLRENAEALAAKMDEYLKPQYDGIHLLRYIGETKRVCVPAQARVVMGALTVLKEQNSVFLVGDMGTGKTQQSLTVAYSMMRKKMDSGAKEGLSVLIVAPSITIPKWAHSEIPQILGKDMIQTTILHDTEDALAYVRKVRSGYKPPKGTIEFVLVSTDRMKLGANKYMLGARWNARKHTWHCPDCGNPLKSPDAKKGEEDVLAGWADVVDTPLYPPSDSALSKAKEEGVMASNGLPKAYVKRWSSKIRRFQCHHCSPTVEVGGEKQTKTNCSLARPALKQRGEDKVRNRWMIAQAFQRMLPHHFHLGIFDEIQLMKASDSGRGAAFHKLLRSCRKSMFLTGTLTNGASSSIQATLWRSDPRSLLEDGFNHQTSKDLWAARYGVLEKVTYRDDGGTTGRTTNRKQETVVIKEKPGIAPQLTANHLLHKSLFLELSDMQLPLVQIREEPSIVTLEEDHMIEYQQFHNKLYDTCRDLQRDLGSKAWASFNPAVLNYADQPHLGQRVVFRDDVGEVLAVVEAPAFPEDYYTAKELKLVEVVKQELAQDRGCIVFNYYTGDYRQNERLQKVLKDHGIQSEILDVSTTSSDGRFEWLEKQKEKGTKVLIMSMSLVQVGLDLMEWPTIIYFQLHDDINVLRQSSRRSWRLGQSKLCKVLYLVNGKTQQMAQFQRLMSRRINALLVEGRIERSDSLAKFAQDDMSNLTRDLSKCLAEVDLANKWKSVAEKDLDQNLELVEESEFALRIKEAFAKLTAETKRLCGVPLDEVKPKVVVDQPEKPILSLVTKAKTSSTNDQMDLFEYMEMITVERLVPKKKKGAPVVELEQFAFAFAF